MSLCSGHKPRLERKILNWKPFENSRRAVQQTSKASAAPAAAAASTSRALQLSLSSHVRSVGESRLCFLRLCRPVGFISGCTALLLDILRQRRHLLFSSWNLTSVCDHSLSLPLSLSLCQVKAILIHRFGRFYVRLVASPQLTILHLCAVCMWLSSEKQNALVFFKEPETFFFWLLLFKCRIKH